MKPFKTKLMQACLVLFMALVFQSSGFCADVDVYGEGVITDGGQLVLYVYADVNVDQLISYGIRVNYNPSELTVISAEKDLASVLHPYTANETKWYIGEDTADYRNNPNPDTATAGEVRVIGGKLDPDNPMLGVSTGERVFLCQITFGPAGTDIPTSPTLSFSYGHGEGTSAYKNFVRINGGSSDAEVLDGEGVSLGAITVAVQGDANGDGSITPGDMITIRNAYYGGGPLVCEPAADCNNDGKITPGDMICVRNKYYAP